MAEATAQFSGSERAAILLMSLGEQEASNVLKHMGAKDVQKVGAAMASLSNVTREQVTGVLGTFVSTVEEQTSFGIGADEYVRNVLVSALGEDKASGLIDRILLGRNTKGLEALKWMDPRAIAEMIRQEHPQIIAIVLSYLDNDQAADVLVQLPERIRTDVVMRIATLDGIQPSALQELDEIMEKQFAGSNNVKSSTVGGIKVAANILNFLDSTTETGIMEEVSKTDSDLGQKIQDLMFVFDNLADLDDRGIQSLLREIQTDTLTIALKGADGPVRDKIFNNMSKRAAEMLADDLEAKGPVRLSEVEAAQKEILAIARKMAEAGTIALGGKGEEYV